MVISIIVISFLIVCMMADVIAGKKESKAIETDKGEILYLSKTSNLKNVAYILAIGYMIFVAITIVIGKKDIYSIVLLPITILFCINSASKKTIITDKGIGLQGVTNRLTNFITWDRINRIYWLSNNRSTLHIEYEYGYMVKELDLAFKDDEIDTINGILGRYVFCG